MTTQTISGAEILMREYIKLGMKVGSRVRDIYKANRVVADINATDFTIKLKGYSDWLSVCLFDLIIEPEEMLFEGTVPDGWELWWNSAKMVSEMIYASEVLKRAWFFNGKFDFVADFSQLTLKRKK